MSCCFFLVTFFNHFWTKRSDFSLFFSRNFFNVYIYLYIYTYIHIYTYICVRIYTYIHVYIYVYTYIYKLSTQDLIPPSSIYIHMCTLYPHKITFIPRFSPSELFGHSKFLVPTPGCPSEYPKFSVCMQAHALTYNCIHSHPCLKI